MSSTTIGPYEIIDKIDKGSFATVYRGRDLRSDEIVAIKIPEEEHLQEPEFVKRFEREAKTAQALDHPNIVRVLDYGVDDGQHYLVMEFVQGRTLDQVLSEGGALPLEEALDISRQIASALESAHAKGVVHRDIKPRNLMITEEGAVKVMDFGIARAAAYSTLTRSGSFMGTPHYISPELARGERADIRSDIYSLGAVLYQMLTGKTPFEAENPWGIVVQHMEAVPPWPSASREGIPDWVDDIVAKMMAKDPADRFPTPTELLAALQAEGGETRPPMAAPEAAMPVPAGKPEAKSGVKLSFPILARAAGGLIIIGLLAFLVLGRIGQRPSPPSVQVVAVVLTASPTPMASEAPTRELTPMASEAPTREPEPSITPVSTPTPVPTPPTDTPVPIPSPTLPLRSGWIQYSNGNQINDMAIAGKYLWAATSGGVVRWDISTGSYEKYTTEHGLIHNSITTIVALGEDDLLFGAWKGGISQFDGQAWTRYSIEGSSEYSQYINHIQAMTMDAAHNLAIGTSSGLLRFDGQLWRIYTKENGLPQNDVRSVAIDDGGGIWVGTSSGAGYFDGQGWRLYTRADGLADDMVHAIAIDDQGGLWFGTEGGVSRFDGQGWTIYNTGDGLVHNSVQAIAIDPEGRLWFGTAGGVSCFDRGEWTTYARESGLVDNDVQAIAVNDQGGLWFGTSGGLSYFGKGDWTTYRTEDSLIGNLVLSTAVDGRGALWFGTDRGVNRLAGGSWETYTSADGLAPGRVESILVDGKGSLWFGTEGGVSRFDGRGWTTFTQEDGLVNNHVKAIAVDAANHLWFGTADGVSRFDGQYWTTYTADTEGLVGDDVSCITIDADGDLWIGTSFSGVSYYDPDGKSWTTYTRSDGLASDSILSAVVDHENRLWFGTDDGLSCFDGNKWVTYHVKDGLAGRAVHSIVIDSQGVLWLGTNGGVSRFDGQGWMTYTSRDGLGDDTVWSISIDRQGNAWFGTNGGISCLRGGE